MAQNGSKFYMHQKTNIFLSPFHLESNSQYLLDMSVIQDPQWDLRVYHWQLCIITKSILRMQLKSIPTPSFNIQHSTCPIIIVRFANKFIQ